MPRRTMIPRGAPGQRALRVGELIRRSLSDILLRGDLHDPDFPRVPITVGEVRVSPDLRHATAMVLPLGGVNTEEVLAALDRNRVELRRLVTAAIDLRSSPELRFEADGTYDRMDEARRLLEAEAVRRDVDAPGEETD